MTRLSALICAALLTFAVTACGGDDEPSSNAGENNPADVEAINAVAAKLAPISESADADAFCKLFEPGRVKATFGSQAACIKDLGPLLKRASNSGKAGAYEIESIDFVNDDLARVTFKDGLGGGGFEKVGGEWWLEAPQAAPSGATADDSGTSSSDQ